MADAVKYGDVVYVRMYGALGTIIGPSENPVHFGADEPVVRVRMMDDGRIVDAGVSSLGEAKELEEVKQKAEKAEAAQAAADEKAASAAEAKAASASVKDEKK